ncbi:MAG: SURF1-like protein [Cypionkella sp.]|uniref:SURF1 family protein n=1 Tax=Cypionkella sp. TaxID=2811411 RepID=UPI002638356A|nr:SURF1 family protein [Cypionkella sp.]MDB5661208.1 SURF1-like protein [Cypionkella sp.]
MKFRLISARLLGLAGVGFLCSLGIWQVQRMYEKRAQLDEMTAGISVPAVVVPAVLDPERDRYRPVIAAGRFTGETLYVLSGQPMVGAGVQVVSVLQMANGRRLLVDRGFLPDEEKHKKLHVRELTVQGNLMWPRDSNQYTPPPDAKTGMWFARDAVAMSAVLHTEPTFIVARAPTGDGIEAMPVDTSSIPNDHWGYAITWFSLAFVWAVMTAGLVWRIRRQV